jgi:hypothetical protein
MKPILAAFVALSLGACATLVRGSDEAVILQSEPSGASVTTTTGLSCPVTPCTLQVPRKDQFVAHFELEGHKPSDIMVGTRMSGGGAAGLAGNAIFGGIIGVVVDSNSGASMDHTPNPVIARLEPLQNVSPVVRAKPRVRSAQAAQ